MSKDRIALVRIETDEVLHPNGPLYIGGALKKAGYDVRLFNIFKGDMAKTVERVIETRPLFVGFSTLSGAQTKYSYEMSKALKERDGNIKIVWGGVHPTMLPEECLREDCIDIVCMGEGEELAVDLADSLSQGRDLEGMAGMGYKTGDALSVSPRRPFIEDLDAFEPDWSLLDDFEKCVTLLPDGRREIGFIASRGCPYNCSFCYNLKFNARRWRRHSIEFVVDRIGYLRKRHDIRAVQFHDDNFFVDMARAMEILERLKKIDVVATSCLIRLEAINEDVLKRLKGLGVRRIFVGWESGTDRVLKLINKGLTRETILEKFDILSKFRDISVTAASIIGFPTETWDEICQTIDFGVRLSEMVPDIVVTFQTFIPYPGSDLYHLAMQNGFSPPKDMSGYDRFDTFAGRMDPTWLPWADENTKTIFYRIDKYGKLLTHSKGSNIVRTLGKDLLYKMSKARLKKKFFAFPWEIAVLYYFNRYYNPKCPV